MGTRKRLAAVLFTDLVGSTDFLSSVDSAVSEAVRTRHFASIRSAIAVHRGREVKTLGDGFMVAHDSVTEALSCAATMQRAVARDLSHAEGLQMRVGLSAGEVTDVDGDLFGMAIVEASRLCNAAGPGQILAAERVRLLASPEDAALLSPIGPMVLKGIAEPLPACEIAWEHDDQGFALRVAIADDSALLREGIARLLEAEGVDVVLQAGDATTLLERLPAVRPDVVLLDMRMPPTFTTEGLDAALQIRAELPDVGVLVLSAELQAAAAQRLLDGCGGGVGYLLKDMVGDAGQLLDAIRTVAGGGSAVDRELASGLRAA